MIPGPRMGVALREDEPGQQHLAQDHLFAFDLQQTCGGVLLNFLIRQLEIELNAIGATAAVLTIRGRGARIAA
jgi:hypothetical protein